MSTTLVREILDRALGTSVANDPGRIITETEAATVIRRILREKYVRAKSIDPLYFSEPLEVDPASGSWPIPAAVGVVMIEAAGLATGGAGTPIANGTEIHLVPLDDKRENAFPPRVYRVGRKYFTVGDTGDPSATIDKLRLFVSKSAPVSAIVDGDSTLPTEWPSDHDDLVAYELAVYCSLKDKARGDMTALNAELEKAQAMFDSHVGGYEEGLVQARHTGLASRPRG